uniref:Uncharacterized protein n=1 Tax=Triticum aestivum TaxID=4565 RepID=A0A077S3Y4_WHEAT|nr:unnamed protein product [Triticum aestivum]
MESANDTPEPVEKVETVAGEGQGRARGETQSANFTPAPAEKVETVAGKGKGKGKRKKGKGKGTRGVFCGRGIELGNCGLILVLFETQSGFAIFTYDGMNLLLDNAVENIWVDFIEGYLAKSMVWLKEFKRLENVSSAIDPVTGVDEDLAMTIRKYIVPGQQLAVGKPEYKTIIEDKLEISCLHDDAVMELMWGLGNCVEYLVPSEKLELTMEGRLRMSKGLKTVLESYDLQVEPEMVNKHIIETAGVVYSCDHSVNKHGKSLRAAGEHLKKISDIDSQDWCLIKLVTALKLLCYPTEELPGIPLEVFSAEEYSKLVNDGPKYEGKLLKVSCKTVFKEMVWARRLRNRMLRLLAHYVREARKAYEEDQTLMSSCEGGKKSI